ncbi:hypothetical protein steven_1 [Pseudomonas phage steven]|nr:hypothetical protein steven_1 [Pseudomonas phage steven]
MSERLRRLEAEYERIEGSGAAWPGMSWKC